MNYRPVICFREIRNHEKDLMRNAESILKELGFKFKATSPFLDDRKWELEFSEDFAKEIYIEFEDDADSHSPTVIIDNILTDQLQTIDGDAAYYNETIIDEDALKDIIENDSSDILIQLIPNISEDEINSLKNKLKDNTDVLLSEMFDMSNHNVSIKSKTQDINLENHINEIYSNSTPLNGISRESLIQDIKELDLDDEETGNNIIDLLFNYIGDVELMNEVYNIINHDEDDDDEDDYTDSYDDDDS